MLHNNDVSYGATHYLCFFGDRFMVLHINDVTIVTGS